MRNREPSDFYGTLTSLHQSSIDYVCWKEGLNAEEPVSPKMHTTRADEIDSRWDNQHFEIFHKRRKLTSREWKKERQQALARDYSDQADILISYRRNREKWLEQRETARKIFERQPDMLRSILFSRNSWEDELADFFQYLDLEVDEASNIHIAVEPLSKRQVARTLNYVFRGDDLAKAMKEYYASLTLRLANDVFMLVPVKQVMVSLIKRRKGAFSKFVNSQGRLNVIFMAEIIRDNLDGIDTLSSLQIIQRMKHSPDSATAF